MSFPLRKYFNICPALFDNLHLAQTFVIQNAYFKEATRGGEGWEADLFLRILPAENRAGESMLVCSQHSKSNNYIGCAKPLRPYVTA